MNLGVTGTRKGATPVQLERALGLIAKRLDRYGSMRLCQGACVGFDEQITVAVKERWPDQVFVCCHPPLNKALMSQRAVDLSDRVMSPKDNLSRDRDIVRHAGDGVIGAPRGFKVQTRGSGTWYTLNFAVALDRSTVVVYPDGKLRPGWVAFGKVGNGERVRGSRRNARASSR